MDELRENYVAFFETYIRETENINAQHIIDFFESIYPLIETRQGKGGSYYESQFDHMKLFVTELVIYTTCLLFKYEQYLVMKELIRNHYFTTNALGQDKEGSIGIFRMYPNLIEELQPNSGGKKFLSYSGHLIIERARSGSISTSDLIQADFLLYLLSFAYGKFNKGYGWFPPTIPYFSNQNIQILNRIKSKRYFEKFKILINVSDKEEAEDFFNKFQEHLLNNTKGMYALSYGVRIEKDDIAKY
ncbi:hypothetical protein [Aquibacillus saliphilus]|uniref:hypothetical protein n=1 Tax=Aquibacillus saliphilus TaxID=1909422 RepID=UPI001CF025BD|nr:hypothetical protein [Aquibacillus saliphilus]